MWSDFEELALGPLAISYGDFLRMRLVHVFYKYKAHKQRILREDNNLRISCMYSVASYWDSKKNGKLTPEKIWSIPEIDGKKEIKLSRIRPQTPEEAKWFKKITGQDGKSNTRGQGVLKDSKGSKSLRPKKTH